MDREYAQEIYEDQSWRRREVNVQKIKDVVADMRENARYMPPECQRWRGAGRRGTLAMAGFAHGPHMGKAREDEHFAHAGLHRQRDQERARPARAAGGDMRPRSYMLAVLAGAAIASLGEHLPSMPQAEQKPEPQQDPADAAEQLSRVERRRPQPERDVNIHADRIRGEVK